MISNLISPNLKVDNYYLTADASSRLNYGVNFVNWFVVHNDREKVAMEICSHMKINIIPAYVQLARTYQDLFTKQTQQTLTENELIFDCAKLADINALLGKLIEDFQQKYTNVFSSYSTDRLKGLLSRPDFKNKKWMKLFNHCELTACKLLYSMIAFLDQNLFIGSNITPRQHYDMADYFFHANLKNCIIENYRKVNYLILKDKYRRFIRWPFGLIVKCILKFICLFLFMPTMFFTSLCNTITDLLFDLFQNELKQLSQAKLNSYKIAFDSTTINVKFPNKNPESKASLDMPKTKMSTTKLNDSNRFAENRSHFVIDQARISVADFCVHCLKALTGTLFHFWAIKEPLSTGDIEALKDYKEVFKGIEDDVYSALHRYTLSTQLKLRPYGFIMNSALLDNLPAATSSDLWKRSIRNEMRTWLQECISIFLNWNFEFVTVYPRPIQAQYTKLSHVSSLYQSMIESLVDFKVVLVLANQLNGQISQCFYDEKKIADHKDANHQIDQNLRTKSIEKPKFFKTNLNPTTQLPWTLVQHLEINFVCKEIDLSMKQTIINKILPSILINEFQPTLPSQQQQQQQQQQQNHQQNDKSPTIKIEHLAHSTLNTTIQYNQV